MSYPVSQEYKQKLENLLKSLLHGTHFRAVMSELFSNSGHFFFLKSLSDITLASWQSYLTEPTEYLLALATLVQAWYLSRPSARRFWGNLIGVAVYTLLVLPRDGLGFFHNPNHIIFWLFSLIIATLQGLRCHWLKRAGRWIIPLETLTRTLLVVAFYLVIGVEANKSTVILDPIKQFTKNATNRFLTWSMVILGLLLGLQTLQITTQRQQLQAKSQGLGNWAEWEMSPYGATTGVTNPKDSDLQRRDRTILFMKLRGFTRWCEQTSPDTIAAALNDYYRSVEPAAAQSPPLQITFTADEILAIYATPEQGVAAAQSMQKAAGEALTPYRLEAGCAVHCGSVIDGLFGSEDVRTYTVIGDVIPTAKYLESRMPTGAITISDAVYQVMSDQLTVEPCGPIATKGKRDTLIAWRLVDSENDWQLVDSEND